MAPYLETNIITKDKDILTFGWHNTALRDYSGNFAGVCFSGALLSLHPIRPNSSSPSCLIIQDNNDFMEGMTENMRSNFVSLEILKDLGDNRGYIQVALNKTTKEKVALKIMRKDAMKSEEIERARREIEIMQQLTKLNNPFIIKLIDAEETDVQFNLVEEYISGGELVTYILKNQGLGERQTQRLFKQMLCAVKCCHDNQIVHRDLKLQNILLDSNNDIKLIDFGLSNFVEVDRFRSTFCGTPAYAPPEILLGTCYKGPEVDLWALGVVLYSMLTAEFPFTTIGDILTGKYKEPEGMSSDCVDLLRKLLTVKMEARATLEDVLNHPWTNSSSEDLSMMTYHNIEPRCKKLRLSSGNVRTECQL